MFPNALDAPACFSQLPVGIEIALTVRFEFIGPPSGVRFWERAVFGTAVPEAAVDKYGHLSEDENDVSATRAHKYRSIHSEPETTRVQFSAQLDLWRRISASSSPHSVKRNG